MANSEREEKALSLLKLQNVESQYDPDITIENFEQVVGHKYDPNNLADNDLIAEIIHAFENVKSGHVIEGISQPGSRNLPARKGPKGWSKFQERYSS